MCLGNKKLLQAQVIDFHRQASTGNPSLYIYL